MVRHGDIEGGALKMFRPGSTADSAVVLGAAIGGTHDQRLAQPSRSACSLSSAGSLISSFPVPRQAISAGLKFGQRQVPQARCANGRGRSWSWGPPETKNPPQGRVIAGR